MLQSVSQQVVLAVDRLDIPLLVCPPIFSNDGLDDALDPFERHVVGIVKKNVEMWALIEQPNLIERCEVQSAVSSDKPSGDFVADEFPCADDMFVRQREMRSRMRIDEALFESDRQKDTMPML